MMQITFKSPNVLIFANWVNIDVNCNVFNQLHILHKRVLTLDLGQVGTWNFLKRKFEPFVQSNSLTLNIFFNHRRNLA